MLSEGELHALWFGRDFSLIQAGTKRACMEYTCVAAFLGRFRMLAPAALRFFVIFRAF